MMILSKFREVLRCAPAFAGRRLSGSVLCGAMALFLALSTNAHAQATNLVCATATSSADVDLCLPQVDDIVLTVGEDVSMELPVATSSNGEVLYSLDDEDDLPNGLNFFRTGAVPLLSGNPTESLAETQFTYSALDDTFINEGDGPSVTFTITVVEASVPTLTLRLGAIGQVAENAAVDASVARAPIASGFPAGSPVWSITGGNIGGAFKINRDTGEVSVAAALDFETTDEYTLTIQLAQGGATATIDLDVMVTNIDEPPAPVGTVDPVTVRVGDGAVTRDVASHFDDPEDDGLTYLAESSDTAVATVSLAGSVVTITPVAAGDATVTVTARDPRRLMFPGFVTGMQEIQVTVQPSLMEPSDGARLSALALSGVTLTPAFDTDTLTYAGTVATSVTSVTVTPTAADADGASITVNGATVASGAASSAINLRAGANTITIVVTAADGTTMATYRVTVTREFPAGASTVTASGAYVVAEDASIGTFVGAPLMANNFPTGTDGAWTIIRGDIGGAFGINSAGRIRVAGLLDHETTPSYRLTVQFSRAGVSATAVVTVTVTDVDENEPPASPTLMNQSAIIGSPFTYQFAAVTDPDGDTVLYGAVLSDGSPRPAWLAFNSATRTFSGTPGAGDAGTITVRVTATDTGSPALSSTATFTISVTGAGGNAPPPSPSLENQFATVGTLFNYSFDPVTDPDGDTVTYRATLSGGGALPAWLTFDPAMRTFSGTPAAGDVTTITVEVTATDDGSPPASSTAMFTISVTGAGGNAPPPAPSVANQSATPGRAFSYQFAAVTDPDGDTVTYSATLSDGGALPAWLTFDAAARAFSGTPTAADAGAIIVRVTATDDGSPPASNMADFTITVRNNPPPPPSVSDQSTTPGRAFSYQFAAVTDPDGDTVAYSATLSDGGALPAWLAFNPATRTFSGTPQAADIGTITVRVAATDDGSPPGRGTATFAITVEQVTVSVLDASGDEGGVVTFEVTLSSALPVPVTVAFSASAQAGDTAMANADFTPVANSTVTFDPGEVSQTVAVAAPDDDAEEDDETFTATLSAAPGSPLPPGVALGRTTATGTIRANAGPADDGVSGRVSEAVLPRVAQAMASSALSAITGRIESAISGGQLRPATRLAGTSSLLHALKGSERGFENGALDLAQALDGSSFVMPLAAASDGDPDGGGALAVWGSADYRSLSDPDDGMVDWDGDLVNFQLGADLQVRPDLLAGVAVSRSSGSYDYTDRSAGAGSGQGRYETDMTSVHPYVSWSPNEALGLWATVGYGLGGIEIDDAAAAGRQSDATMQMAAVGASHRLLSVDDGAFAGGGATLRLKGEGSIARIEVDGEDRIPAASYDAQRLRLSLEGRYECPPGASDGCLAPSVEAGVRHDGGDGTTGTGIELGGGLRYANRASGLTLEARGRALVAGQDGRDWGVGGLIRIDPGADRLGLSFSLTPAFGDAASKVERLYNADRPETSGGGEPSGRLDAEIGYGLAGLDGVATPYVGASLAEAGDASQRLGVRFAFGSSFSLGLEGTRRESRSSATEHGVMLRGRLRW